MFLLIPTSDFSASTHRLGTSEKDGETRHWNVPLKITGDGKWHLMTKGGDLTDVSRYLVTY